jgi:hypothetical protein
VLALKPLDVRFVVIALAVGLPIAMLLAWVYEFTPEGIVRTEDLQRHKQDRVSAPLGGFSTSSLSPSMSFSSGLATEPSCSSAEMI